MSIPAIKRKILAEKHAGSRKSSKAKRQGAAKEDRLYYYYGTDFAKPTQKVK